MLTWLFVRSEVYLHKMVSVILINHIVPEDPSGSQLDEIGNTELVLRMTV